MGIVVVNPGPLTLVEDLGRQGWAALGLSPSGALDRQSLRLANALVGNPATAAGLEILLGGLRLRFVTASYVAVAGAEGSVTLNGAEIPLNQAVPVAPGAVLDFAVPLFGLRYYLAVQGGIDAPRLLGSRSTDMLSGEGPAPLASGDHLGIGSDLGGGPELGAGSDLVTGPLAVPAIRRAPDPARAITVRVDRGPRADWFDHDSWRQLVTQGWTLSADSNRIGARLVGRPLKQTRTEDLPSEGMVLGALQVPPSGLPTVFLADHPVTGGYPVIAVVRRADLDVLGQARPGQRIRFVG
ncbi:MULTISPECIES: biotin-dependent carboxyltransferase family protein [Arthrobacter]|uniref:Biotin-dependent carboxyltransferase n=1 Tax=Arthrobacter terricola TaxID=2547396 RepID=A0A4R5KRJ0_9MICC|nr:MULTISPECIES: biotin-dependent carboxyltransferase family protein [Arthrobacter]MBT8160535.1 biotin-dependent carboxyltransferase family protein [Arthrobacter sp. GN70]TDF98429.1 biotin-dependent carboxyltransferase [Arthrobacter terricola]